ncbi:MAG: ACP S-malonyltransferase, partial [bacterium]
EAFPESKAVFDRADQVLGFSLSKIIFEGQKEELTETENAQPAILTMTIACWEAALAAGVLKPDVCDYAAGLSLGEYSALVAVGAVAFEDALNLVRRRGEFMEEEAAKRPGKMLSVIGLELAVVRELCVQTNTEVANINSPGQIVISGGIKEIEQAKALAQEKGAKRVISLEVSGAFHSSFMQGACVKLAKELQKVRFSKPRLSLISNVTVKVVTDPGEIKDNLVRQISSSVLWEDSMKFMLSKGVVNFIELGPGKVLKGLMRRINETAVVNNIEKKEDIIGLGEKR